MRRILWLLPLMLFIIGGCSLEDPGSPKWQVELTIPVADKEYSMYDLIADSAAVDTLNNWVSENGDTLIFNFADSLDRVTIEDQLRLDSFSYIIENFVGIRSVNAPGLQTAIYPLEDLASGISGDTSIVPPFDIDVQEYLDPFPEFDWVDVAYGDVTVTVTNDLPVDIYNLTISIYGVSPEILVVHTDIPGPMAPDSSVTQVWPLPTGVEIDNEMEVRVHVESDGSSWFVNITNAALTVDVNLAEDIGVTAAMAHIPEQNFDADTVFSLLESDTVTSATIKEGFLTYSLINETEMINNVTFILPDFQLNDQPLTEEFTVNPGETYSQVDIDLAGYVFYRPQGDNLIDAQVDVQILDTEDPAYSLPDGFIELNEDQMVGTDFQVTELIFDSFEGVLDTLEIEIDQDAVELEGIPEGFESLELDYTNIDLQISNAIGLPLNLDISINAYKNGSLAETLDLPPLTVPPGDTVNPALLDTTLGGLEQIINVIPDEIELTGTAFIYGEVAVGEWQWLDVEFLIYTPFALKIGDTYFEPEITEIDEGFDNQLELVDMTINLISHMPLSGEAFIIASHDSAGFTDPDTFLQVTLPTATLGPDGFVVTPGESSVEQTLNFDQLEMFAGADEDNLLYIKTLVLIHSTEGQTIYVNPYDYLTVGAVAHAVVNVDFEDDEEEGGGQ